jgi:hypothetical protein
MMGTGASEMSGGLFNNDKVKPKMTSVNHVAMKVFHNMHACIACVLQV